MSVANEQPGPQKRRYLTKRARQAQQTAAAEIGLSCLPVEHKPLYLALATADYFVPGLHRELNKAGGACLTGCPHCHVDDFCHVEGCKIADEVERAVSVASADYLRGLAESLP